MILIDPKRVELADYEGVPHLMVPVVKEIKQAANALKWAVLEMDDRYKLFATHGTRNIEAFNKKAAGDPILQPIHHLVIIIDELADLMMTSPQDVEDAICRLAQMARAVGIHLVLATQRPSVNVITGLIKANIPSRIAFSVASQIDSRTILDGAGAEKLLGGGDMLYIPVGSPKPIRLQGCFVSDGEIKRTAEHWRSIARPQYDEEILEEREGFGADGEPGEGERDPLFDEAVKISIQSQQGSASLLQRKLKVGYARASRLVDQMETAGLVGSADGSKAREVLVGWEWFEERARQKAQRETPEEAGGSPGAGETP
jgi:S-DNA-T family DNA segregation ATPase FtsK/SpoIIIE